MDRRDFLAQSFKSMVLSALAPSLGGCFREENNLNFLAQSSQQMNYVQLNLYGGPVRWGFDNFLKPLEDQGFIKTPMVGSRFSDSEGDVELAHIKRQGYEVPHFWGLKLKNGKEHSFLLKNMMTIRGVDIDVLGHPLGIIKTVRPESEHPSIHGLISDHHQTPLPAVIFGSNPAT